MVDQASLEVSEILIVDWDITITYNGHAHIENDESSHTVVMQFYVSPDEKRNKGSVYRRTQSYQING